MKIIDIKHCTLSYPVGKDMSQAMIFVKYAAEALKKKFKDKGIPINIWCRGSSGSILGTLLTCELKGYTCKLQYVRKTGEKAHSPNVFYGLNLDDIYIIIDDQVSTGKTLQEIYKSIEEFTCNRKTIDMLILNDMSSIDHINFNVDYLVFPKFRMTPEWRKKAKQTNKVEEHISL